LIEPALAGLHTALKSGEIPSIVKAAQIVLDRTGFHPSRAIELTGKDGGPIEAVNTISLERLSPEEMQTLIEILEKAGAGEGNQSVPILIRTD
jgi:hypothetical protein